MSQEGDDRLGDRMTAATRRRRISLFGDERRIRHPRVESGLVITIVYLTLSIVLAAIGSLADAAR